MNKSIETLKRFNAWRTGEDDRTMDEAGIVPSEVTKAIDDVVNMHDELVAALLESSRLSMEDGGLGPEILSHFEQIIDPLLERCK